MQFTQNNLQNQKITKNKIKIQKCTKILKFKYYNEITINFYYLVCAKYFDQYYFMQKFSVQYVVAIYSN